MKQSPLVAIAIVWLAPILLAAAERQETIRGTCMGTKYAVTVVDRPAQWPLASLDEEIGDELERIEQIFSLYRPASELSRVNAAASGEWIAVSSDLLAVTRRALRFAGETEGAFDPTVGPLVKLWRLAQVKGDWTPPSEAEIAEVQKRVGFRRVETRDAPPALRKLTAGVELDLNALVEGWAIDRVINLLREENVNNALVELGGEFRAVGHKPDGQPWKIGIEHPIESNSLYATAALDNLAVATSGTYRQTIEINGRRYGHLVDPRTGKPVEHELVAVSVLARDAMTADGWATALMVLGPVYGLALAEKNGLVASFVVRSTGRPQITLTKAAAGKILISK